MVLSSFLLKTRLNVDGISLTLYIRTEISLVTLVCILIYNCFAPLIFVLNRLGNKDMYNIAFPLAKCTFYRCTCFECIYQHRRQIFMVIILLRKPAVLVNMQMVVSQRVLVFFMLNSVFTVSCNRTPSNIYHSYKTFEQMFYIE